MNKFIQEINVAYPPGNKPIFEEWFAQNYSGCDTDRELIPFYPTSYWVNNGYGNDIKAKQEAQEFIDSLDRSKKWFVICQYDDGVLVDWKDLDVLEFNMSKNIGIGMPLLCRPHPYTFNSEKKWLANFVGSKTHPIRDYSIALKNNPEYYISFDQHDIETYCRILHESIFTLCFRGYGLNSFRIGEAIQYGSIPVYISDEHIHPYNTDFQYFGIVIKDTEAKIIHEILSSIETEEIMTRQHYLKMQYESHFTFSGNLALIINELNSEYHQRSIGEDIQSLG